DEIKRWIDGIDTKLLRGVPVRSRRAIGVHDTARQKIAYALAMLGCVSSVDIIEGAVLADQHDHVFDRRRRLYAIGVIIAFLGRSKSTRHQCDQRGADGSLQVPTAMEGSMRHACLHWFAPNQGRLAPVRDAPVAVLCCANYNFTHCQMELPRV